MVIIFKCCDGCRRGSRAETGGCGCGCDGSSNASSGSSSILAVLRSRCQFDRSDEVFCSIPGVQSSLFEPERTSSCISSFARKSLAALVAAASRLFARSASVRSFSILNFRFFISSCRARTSGPSSFSALSHVPNLASCFVFVSEESEVFSCCCARSSSSFTLIRNASFSEVRVSIFELSSADVFSVASSYSLAISSLIRVS
mmetsp:Transcript_26030/g.36273  ORF Transcript_26030/g.36273 Transcript_26030/m.36273 type:complete len:202 (-) Transcript_26030:14-619(-)